VCSAHTVYLCVVCGSENKQRLVPYTALTDWFFIIEMDCVYCAVRTGCLYIILRSAHTVYLCAVCGSENKQQLVPYTALTDWFFIIETDCVYCAVRTGCLYIILRSAHTVYLCVVCGSENKQRLFPYTALTDWFL